MLCVIIGLFEVFTGDLRQSNYLTFNPYKMKRMSILALIALPIFLASCGPVVCTDNQPYISCSDTRTDTEYVYRDRENDSLLDVVEINYPNKEIKTEIYLFDPGDYLPWEEQGNIHVSHRNDTDRWIPRSCEEGLRLQDKYMEVRKVATNRKGWGG